MSFSVLNLYRMWPSWNCARECDRALQGSAWARKEKWLAGLFWQLVSWYSCVQNLISKFLAHYFSVCPRKASQWTLLTTPFSLLNLFWGFIWAFKEMHKKQQNKSNLQKKTDEACVFPSWVVSVEWDLMLALSMRWCVCGTVVPRPGEEGRDWKTVLLLLFVYTSHFNNFNICTADGKGNTLRRDITKISRSRQTRKAWTGEQLHRL